MIFLRVALLALLLPSGCVPFISPPIQAQVGSGLRRLDGTRFSGTPRSEPVSRAIQPPLQVKLGANPLQYLRGYTRRPIDFGAGYLLETDSQQTSIQGAYLEVTPVMAQAHVGKIRRISLRGQGRLLRASGQEGWGYGGAVQLTGELGGFVPGEIDYRTGGSGIVGYGWGESTIGFYAEMGYSQIDALRAFTMTGGLQFRIPATIGATYLFVGDAFRDPPAGGSPGGGPAPGSQPPGPGPAKPLPPPPL